MDITLSLIGKQTAHVLPAEQEGARWKIGQIAGVYRSSDVATKLSGKYHIKGGVGSKVLVFIHIKNTPGASAKKIHAKLTRSLGVDVISHRATFRLNPADLPQAVKDALMTDREITTTWAAAKPFLKHSVTQTPIEDGDLV